MKLFKLSPKFYIVFALIALAPATWIASLLNAAIEGSSSEYVKNLFSSGAFEAPTAVILIFALIGLYESFLWRIFPLKYLQGVPDIRGRYTGKIVSSYGEGSEYDVVIEIQQTLSDISVRLFTERSSSHSVIANIGKNEKGNWFLAYIYKNSPKTIKDDLDMRTHDGFACLDVFPRELKIDGHYFNDPRERATHGHIICQLESRILKGHF